MPARAPNAACQRTVLNILHRLGYPEIRPRVDLHKRTSLLLLSVFSLVAGDFSLDIFPVMLDDDARYQCQVGPGLAGEPGIRSKFASLTVLVPPEPPRIVQGDFLVTTEDREIELECVSLAGKPAAEVREVAVTGSTVFCSVTNTSSCSLVFPKSNL
jgi:hypothetical protein